MTEPLVVVTDIDLPSDGGAADLLRAAGCRVEVAACTTADEVAAAAAGATALIVQWANVDAAALDALPEVRFISRLGIGYDMIDVDAATARGVAVANTPDYCVEEVATHTVAMALSLLRALPGLEAGMRAGRWAPTADGSGAVRPSETTVAIVGFGRIGSSAALALRAAGFRVLVSDPFVSAERIAAAGLEAAPLDEALAQADLVSLHTPLTAETRHLLDGERLATMKPGVRIVNTCRGGLIDEQALIAALAGGQVGGAALDVYEDEPLPADSGLRHAPNLMLTPHAAWFSPAALAELPRRAAENVVAFLANHPVPSIVNPAYVASAGARQPV
ncbi:C-terminal binding protein [Conexibacter arvalis]|uniref:Phosphoglycerate dehydrogenase-like enzyme n=1 Tax=Conexibacter arvalis TaxID=912552 RepID=A0A840I9D9_9ACTN|nr:C-terminal binding protein [Conexibacter arvalis]MBB4660935.1 phosphoglycerate dehydrogenase-like enzyme [Conexibacter arvalis]